MLTRDPRVAAKKVRSRANQKRYRLRRVRGQSVRMITTHDERLIDLLVAKRYLPDNAIHDRVEIDRALTKFIDDEGRKNIRYR